MTTYCIWNKITILLLQFAKNRMSISSKLRTQEEVKNVSSKRNTLYKGIIRKKQPNSVKITFSKHDYLLHQNSYLGIEKTLRKQTYKT